MADKIDIVVGASDKASAILRSVADQTQLLSESLKSTDTNARSLEISMSNVGVAAGLLGAAYAGLQASASITKFIGTSSAEFQKVEKSIGSLKSALESFSDVEIVPIQVGDPKFDPKAMGPLEIEVAIDGKINESSIRDFAKRIEQATNIDESEIFGTLRSALAKGFDVAEIDEVTKAAIGLSSVLEVSLAEGLSKAQQAAEGNFAAFENLIPGLGQMATNEEKLAAVSALATEGLQRKADTANDAVAVFDRMNVQLHNLYETVGGIVEPFRQLAYQGIAVVSELLSQSLQPAIEDFQEQFSGMGDYVRETAKAMTEGIVSAFTLVEVTLFNLGTVSELAGASVMLSLEQMRSNLEHIFTVAIPAYANWFAENFINILSDVGGMTIALFSNLGTSIGEIMAGLWNYVTSGFSADAYEQLMHEVGRAANRGLLEGFEPVTAALPDIGERAVSDFEKTLSGMVENSASTLVGEYDRKVTERLKLINESFSKNPIEASVNIKSKGDAGLGLNSEVKMLQAVESRVMVRGSAEDPLLKTMQQQTKLLQDLVNATERRESKPDWSAGLILEGVD